MKTFLLLLILVSLKNVYSQLEFDDVGDPLILTPLIEANNINEARRLAEVHYPEFQNISSYSGYFTVDKRFNSNLYFWFFPSQNDFKNDPVLIWLQGGPGNAVTPAIFNAHGPFIIDANDTVTLRQYSWNKYHSVLYIDSPVGAGYSFTDEGGYAQNQTKVSESLYSALLQFFQLFPELQKNEFFITGQSYAGKFVTSLGYAIHKHNPNASLKINLKGLSMGNGMIDPVNQADYGDYLYQAGLVDASTRDLLRSYRDKVQYFVKQGDYTNATKYYYTIILDSIRNATGLTDLHNYLLVKPNQINYLGDFIDRKLRKVLHTGNATFGNAPVFQNLWDDITTSVAPWLAEMLDNYRVLLYIGQVDMLLPYPFTENYLQKLYFSGAEEYKRAARYIWRNDEGIVGYFKKAGNLTEVMVRDAGHLVPNDQPKRAYELIYKFVRNMSLND